MHYFHQVSFICFRFFLELLAGLEVFALGLDAPDAFLVIRFSKVLEGRGTGTPATITCTACCTASSSSSTSTSTSS
jgi:hypothetical protein